MTSKFGNRLETCEDSGKRLPSPMSTGERSHSASGKKRKTQRITADQDELPGNSKLDIGATNPGADGSPGDGGTSASLSNLELVQMLQDSKIPRSRKIGAAYAFVKSQETVSNSHSPGRQKLKIQIGQVYSITMPQFVSFLSEWVQAAILWSSKPQQIAKTATQHVSEERSKALLPPYLDSHCWGILSWCLSSAYMNSLSSVSPSLMRSLNLYVIALLGTLDSAEDPPDMSQILFFSDDSVRSVETLLLANERSFRPDLDHWVSLAATSLSKLTSSNLRISSAEEKLILPVRQLLLSIVEGFARFVAVHPNRRKIFTSLVENLLETLLVSHAWLSSQCGDLSSCVLITECPSWYERVLQAIENIVEKGLFHAAHVGSFQEVCAVLARNFDATSQSGSTEKKSKRRKFKRDVAGNLDGENRDMHLSYHKLLFQKLDYFREERMESPLMELGWIFKIYSKSFSSHRTVGNVDVFGNQSKEKLHILAKPIPSIPDDSHGEGNTEAVQKPPVDRKARTSEILFNVWAEFIGSLMEDLRKCNASIRTGGGTLEYQHLHSAKVLMGAINGLLKSAKTEKVYVRTEDSANQPHCTFLEKCFSTVLETGICLPGAFSSYIETLLNERNEPHTGRGDIQEQEPKVLLAEVLRELIIAIKFFMEIEYRVAENSLQDVWVILFTEVATQRLSRDHLPIGDAAIDPNQYAIELACQMVSMFSDLRQVYRPLFSLCATLRTHVFNGLLKYLPETNNLSHGTETKLLSVEYLWFSYPSLGTIEFLVFAKSLRLAIASAMCELPEGQVPEFLSLLRVDLVESMTLVDIGDNFMSKVESGYEQSVKMRSAVALKGLVELYCHMLDNINITASNSVQSGKAVRHILTQIVAPKLAEKVEFFMLSLASKEDDAIEGHSSLRRKSEKKDAGKEHFARASKNMAVESHLDTWVFLFLLRMYITSQSLHTEFVSVMPPKAASKAVAVLDGPVIDYHRPDVTDILTLLGARNFLSAAGRGAVQVSDFLVGIERSLDRGDLAHHPALHFSVECVALQCIAKISKQVAALRFLLERGEESMNGMSNGAFHRSGSVVKGVGAEPSELVKSLMPGDVNLSCRKKLQKLLSFLKKESHLLTNTLLKEIVLVVDASQGVMTMPNISDSPGQQEIHELDCSQLLDQRSTGQSSNQFVSHHSWDMVVTTLREDILAVQRWHLLCRTFDVWSVHALKEDLKQFLVVLLRSSLVTGKVPNVTDHARDVPESTAREKDMRCISEELLINASFYEDESIRRVFTSTYLEELQRSLHCAFGERVFGADVSDAVLEEEILISCAAEDCSDFIKLVKDEIGVIGQVPDSRGTSIFSSKQAFAHDRKNVPSAPMRQGSNSTGSKSPSMQTRNGGLRWDNTQLKALNFCDGLVDYLSRLPLGYLKSSDATSCAYALLWFERLLMTCLLHFRSVAAVESPDLADFSPICVLLKAFSTCRSALLALTFSERPCTGSPPVVAILAGNFASIHWLSLSVHVASTCLVDILQCSKLPENERKLMKLLGNDSIHTVLNRTASLVSYISDETLRLEAKMSSYQDPDQVSAITEGIQQTSQRIMGSSDQEEETHLLDGLMGYQAEILDQLINRAVAREMTFSHEVDCQADGIDAVSGSADLSKDWCLGLALAASLCSYAWSLNNCFKESVEESTAQTRPLIGKTETRHRAQKLCHVLTGTLLSAILPVGSHAVFLFGEHKVDKNLISREENNSIVVKKYVLFGEREVDKNLISTKEKNSVMLKQKQHASESIRLSNEAEYDSNDDNDCPSAMDTAEAMKEGEVEDEEEMGEDANDGHRSHQIVSKREEFGRYMPVRDISEESYTENSQLQRTLLENMLDGGCCREKCELIGELYLTMAGFLRLESAILSKDKIAGGSSESPVQGGCGWTLGSNVVMGAGYWLLLKAAEKTEPIQWSRLSWLVGVVKYMESSYSLLPYLKPPLSPIAFSKLFSMHIQLLGSLPQSEEFLHSLKYLHPLDIDDQHGISFGFDTSSKTVYKDEGKSMSSNALRMAVRSSLGILLQTASRHHLVLALQSLMRALVGASEGSTQVSGLEIRGLQVGKVGRDIASGVECLSIALEVISGTKGLRLLANHFNEFFGAIFNILEYLEGPHLFRNQGSGVVLGEIEVDRRTVWNQVDSGPVILQALHVLITAASRNAIFPMKACHVALAFHCPGRIFSPLSQSGSLKRKFIQSFFSQQSVAAELKQVQVISVERISSELGVKLYISCCRLMCSLIRHRRRESGHCITLLGDSARILLHCLEAPNWPCSDEAGTRVSVNMATYCASWLGRIYEEMGEHKETLGKYCCHILSDYLTVLAGHGPHEAGLTSEVEAALQPGACVLVDACSANDLQQLHASLGEGPRRNALLNMKRQYQQQFKYTGKV